MLTARRRSDSSGLPRPEGTSLPAEARRSDGLRLEVLRVRPGDEVHARGRIHAQVPEDVLDAGVEAGLGGHGEVVGVAVVDRPDFEHVVAAPGGARRDPHGGEDDVRVREHRGRHDRIVDRTHLDGINTGPRAGAEQITGATEPALLRPLDEYAPLAGGRF